MFELMKLVWNAMVLRDSIKKGEMTAGVWGAALLFLFVLVCISVPTILYLNRHPDAPASVLIYPAIPIGLLMIVYFWLSIRWRLSLNRQRAAKDSGSPDHGDNQSGSGGAQGAVGQDAVLSPSRSSANPSPGSRS